MVRNFEKLVDRTFKILKSSGFQEENYADFIVFILYWRFVTDHELLTSYAFDKIGFANAKDDQYSNIGLAVRELVRQDKSTQEFINISMDLHNIGAGTLREILNSWLFFFEQSSAEELWKIENVNLYFETITEKLARTVRDAHLFFTPSEVVQLMMSTVHSGTRKIYDPYCRSGDFLGKAFENINDIEVIGDARDPYSRRLAKARLFLLNKRYERIDHKLPFQLDFIGTKFDSIISNPPFGAGSNYESENPNFYSQTYKSNRYEVSYLTHVLDHLSETGEAAIIVPKGFLFSAGVNLALRAELIKKNHLEAIVELPPKIFYHTGVSTAILILSKRKKTDNILFIDSSSYGVKEQERYTLKQNSISLISETIKEFKKKGECEDNNNILTVSKSDIEKANYDLQFSVYDSLLRPQEITHKSSRKLWKECSEIQTRVADIQNQLVEMTKKAP